MGNNANFQRKERLFPLTQIAHKPYYDSSIADDVCSTLSLQTTKLYSIANPVVTLPAALLA
jgi:hypothetical protein